MNWNGTKNLSLHVYRLSRWIYKSTDKNWSSDVYTNFKLMNLYTMNCKDTNKIIKSRFPNVRCEANHQNRALYCFMNKYV